MSSQRTQSFALTDVGRKREHNEDAYLVDEDLGLFVVADGMGGHAAGEVASSMSCESVYNTVKEHKALLDSFRKSESPRQDVARMLELAVQRACAEVFQEGQRDPNKRGMGTTLEVLLLCGNRAFVAHVGDSRVYLHRGSELHQLTEDHSLINELLKRRQMTPEQLGKIKYKNAVTRAVGVYESVEADLIDLDVLPGDGFLMCSDGLVGHLEDPDIQQALENSPIEMCCQYLIDTANQRGGKDNITTVLAKLPDDGARSEENVREVQLKFEVLHQMPIFQHLNYQELVRVINVTEMRTFRKDEDVVHQGDDGEELFIVLSGTFTVHRGGNTLTEFGPGEHFGEMALIDREPRSANVTAVTPGKLLVVDRKRFYHMVRSDHDVAVKLLWSFLRVLSTRLRSTSSELGEAKDQLDASVDTLDFGERDTLITRTPVPPSHDSSD